MLAHAVTAAPRSQIVVRLFEHFAADIVQARAAIAVGDIAAKANAIDHAMRIVAELVASLDHAAAPELCGNLAAMYGVVTAQLSEANLMRTAAPLDRAERVMTELGAAFAQIDPR